ncbi:MAG: SDR family NAD(P)-dependent oxidoreductase [Alphaproteobacteria bacterium]|nr:SDR family NAD(P)-dependent oxidoreductase [Alphaproteobacteria bacterium]
MVAPLKDFNGKIAVVTGGGTGMGREMVRQLVAEGCTVAMCDVIPENMAKTRDLCEQAGIPQGTRIMSYVADVASEDALNAFAKAVAEELKTDRIHLLFNNAGVGGGGSFVAGNRSEWEKTFGICWYGVYYSCRAFLPMLLKADRAHITNTSSVNGFWASLGPNTPHTAYSAAKFAVKGFTEALITDLRLNAPHVTCSVVMPGHIGTAIARNSRLVLDSGEMSEAELKNARERAKLFGFDGDKLTREDIGKFFDAMADNFENNAPTTAAQATKIILDGVKANKWRILVGDDAHKIDAAVRQAPEIVYEPEWQNPLLSVTQPTGPSIAR